MKTALLHYWLTNVRGGEKVLFALRDMFPDADVFTHACTLDVPAKESFIASLPFGRRRPQAYLPLMPLASRLLDLDGYDLVISSESGPIKGIRKPAGTRHVCYCHTPMRYVWDMYDEYYRTAGICGKLAMPLFVKYMRYEDLKSADSVDRFVANSHFVAERIKRIYGRESDVVHPPVDVEFFSAANPSNEVRPELTFSGQGSYYLYAGELRSYKRPELAIAACEKMNRNLVVLGNGGMRVELEKKCAGNPRVKFLGRVDDDCLRDAYSNAKALLFPGIEDFGIVPVEAQAAGTPVIAFGKGGALETVDGGRTGLFFEEPTVDGLCAAIEEFEARAWSADDCRANAVRFSKARFAEGMSRVIG